MTSVLPFSPQSSGPALPLPGKKRWQPLRAGVVEIFFYDVEEFWFIDGHIVYRGNNGTGKSKLLALTLPQADEAWLAEFAAGFAVLARGHEVALVGGDTTRGPLCVTVQLLGHGSSASAPE